MIDNRITCERCRDLAPNGRCRVAARGERLDVGRDYGPAQPYLPWRCEFFTPHANDPDQRSGRVRYPELYAEYQEKTAERLRVRREIGERGMARVREAIGK